MILCGPKVSVACLKPPALTFLADTPAARELRAFLEALDAGEPPSVAELRHADAKEEPGRRDGHDVLPGPAEVDEVARRLWPELACMANTPGGGAIVLGVANDGTRTGVTVEPEALRHRLWQLSGERMTVRATPHRLEDGTAVLLLEVPPALTPLEVEGRIRWRVDTNCVDVDPSTWFASMGRPSQEDWSAQPSTSTVADVDPLAASLLRRFLDAANRTTQHEGLGDVPVMRSVVGLVVDDRGTLTRAGQLLMTEQSPAIDYVHRPATGQEATIRLRERGSVLEQLARVLDAVRPRLTSVSLPVPGSPVVAQHERLPFRAVREAVVNALVHRDWSNGRPVVVEHIGDRLTVTSPGGFLGSVTADNVLTHPSLSRAPALAAAANAAGIAEQQGVGVDRMYLDLLLIGRPSPRIEERPGPLVRARLYGGEPDREWWRFHRLLAPDQVADDLRVLLVLDLLSRDRFATLDTIASTIQDDRAEARDVMDVVEEVMLDGERVVLEVAGRPAAVVRVWGPTAAMRQALGGRLADLDLPARRDLLSRYAQVTGRVSTTEVRSLLDVAHGTANSDLKALHAQGLVEPATASDGGRGFHYLPF